MELNNPSRSDFYKMKIARELRVLQEMIKTIFAKEPMADVRVEDCKLNLVQAGQKDTPPMSVPPAPAPPSSSDATSDADEEETPAEAAARKARMEASIACIRAMYITPPGAAQAVSRPLPTKE